MRKQLLLLVVLFAVVVLAAYVSGALTMRTHRITKGSVQQIEEGMTEQEVEAMLGVPAGNYSVPRSEVLYLYSNRPRAGGWDGRGVIAEDSAMEAYYVKAWVSED